MELLIELSNIVIAGYVVSYLFDNLRTRYDGSTWYGRILHTPRSARWLTLTASAAFATAAAYTAQYFGGPAADPAVTAAWAAVTSQAVHAVRHLSPEPTHGEGE